MLILSLLVLPIIAGLLSFIIHSNFRRRFLLLSCAFLHFILTLLSPHTPVWSTWLALDDLGFVFLLITSILFLAASIYAVTYLQKEEQGHKKDFEEGVFFSNFPEAIFTSCLLFFLAMMTLVTLSQHLGLLWVAMEGTTLASAPLIYFHRQHRSLEATWKYLLICSVGIALALLGTLFLAKAALNHPSMVLKDLLAQPEVFNLLWLKAAFLLCFVGYGTKMGLAPLHNWLPDAHSEAPSLVSALLSGALLNCAFLAILRFYQIIFKTSLLPFAQNIFLFFGLLSMLFAAFFILGQKDYKRMLAYSSIENMGLLSLGIGLGGGAVFGTLFHAFNHSFTKAALFFVAGNILTAYQTKNVDKVNNCLKVIPISAVLWILGFLSIVGTPPFGTFLSKMLILKEAFLQERWWVIFWFFLSLSVAFVGMAKIIFDMVQNRSSEDIVPRKESFSFLVSPIVLLLLVLILGVFLFPPLKDILIRAVALLGGKYE